MGQGNADPTGNVLERHIDRMADHHNLELLEGDAVLAEQPDEGLVIAGVIRLDDEGVVNEIARPEDLLARRGWSVAVRSRKGCSNRASYFRAGR